MSEAGLYSIDHLIEKHGDGAYDEAVRLTVLANILRDQTGVEHYAAIGVELLKRGYHKKGSDQEEAGNNPLGR